MQHAGQVSGDSNFRCIFSSIHLSFAVAVYSASAAALPPTKERRLQKERSRLF